MIEADEGYNICGFEVGLQCVSGTKHGCLCDLWNVCK